MSSEHATVGHLTVNGFPVKAESWQSKTGEFLSFYIEAVGFHGKEWFSISAADMTPSEPISDTEIEIAARAIIADAERRAKIDRETREAEEARRRTEAAQKEQEARVNEAQRLERVAKESKAFQEKINSKRTTDVWPIEPLVAEVLRSPAFGTWDGDKAEPKAGYLCDGHALYREAYIADKKVADYLRKPAKLDPGKERLKADLLHGLVKNAMTDAVKACVRGYIVERFNAKVPRIVWTLDDEGNEFAFNASLIALMLAAFPNSTPFISKNVGNGHGIVFVKDGEVAGVAMGLQSDHLMPSEGVFACVPGTEVQRVERLGKNAGWDAMRPTHLSAPTLRDAGTTPKFNTPLALLAEVRKSLDVIRDKKSSFPLLSGALLRVENRVASLTVTNITTWARLLMPAEVERQGSAMIPADLLSEIGSGPGFAEIEAMSTGSPVGPVRMNLAGVEYRTAERDDDGSLSVENFPVLRESQREDPALFNINAEAFSDALSRVIPFASEDRTRPHLTGIYFVSETENDAGFKLVATDGHRLAVYEADGMRVMGKGKGVYPQLNFILPIEPADFLRRKCLWQELPAGKPKGMRNGGGITAWHSTATGTDASPSYLSKPMAVAFHHDNGDVMWTKTTDAAFPSYNQVIPNDSFAAFICKGDRDTMLKVLKPHTEYAKKNQGRGLPLGIALVMSTAGNLMVDVPFQPDGDGMPPKATKLADASQSTPVVKSDYPEKHKLYKPPMPGKKLERLQLGVTWTYLVDALEACDAGVVTMMFSGELDPIKIVGGHLTCVVMPRRL